jgi:hypothetical protein
MSKTATMKTLLVSELEAKRLGGLKGRITIRRDLVNIDTTRDWEMLQRGVRRGGRRPPGRAAR